MFGIRRILIARHERGLYLKDRSLIKILKPGIHYVFDPMARIVIETYNVIEPEFDHPYVDVWVIENRELVNQYFQLIELGSHEVALVYKNSKLDHVLPPGTRQLYWQGPIEITTETLNIEDDFVVPKAIAELILHARADTQLLEIMNDICFCEVADNHIGLLMINGKLVKNLNPGLYAYWRYHHNIRIELVELRLQVMEVQGQEILAKDKVSLRINLSAHYQVTDVNLARSKLVNITDYLYRELQFGLRQAVGARTLDNLLGNKDDLDREIYTVVRDKAEKFGITVNSVGVKDVILPGDMKDILNQVVEAEKVAQANVIRRREETAATRSLLNTARLMEDNPTLMRLKEFEVLEKITEKVDRLTVFGGLDSVINDTVKINVNAA